MKLALYKNGMRIALWENVNNVVSQSNGDIEVYIQSEEGEIKIDYFHKDYDLYEVWRTTR